MTMKTLSRITAILFQLRTNMVRRLAITTVFLSSVIIVHLGTLKVRQLAMTMTTLSRITTIQIQLGTNKVRQLAITTVILSSVILFLLGTLTVRQLAMMVKTCLKLLLFCFNWE